MQYPPRTERARNICVSLSSEDDHIVACRVRLYLCTRACAICAHVYSVEYELRSVAHLWESARGSYLITQRPIPHIMAPLHPATEHIPQVQARRATDEIARPIPATECALERVSKTFQRLALEEDGPAVFTDGKVAEEHPTYACASETEVVNVKASNARELRIRRGSAPSWVGTPSVPEALADPRASRDDKEGKGMPCTEISPPKPAVPRVGLQRRRASVVPRRVEVAKAPRTSARKLPRPLLQLDTGLLTFEGEKSSLSPAPFVSAPCRNEPDTPGQAISPSGKEGIRSPRATRLRLSRLPAKRSTANMEPMPVCNFRDASRSTDPDPFATNVWTRGALTSPWAHESEHRLCESPIQSSCLSIKNPAQKQELFEALGTGLASPTKAQSNPSPELPSKSSISQPSSASLSSASPAPEAVSLLPDTQHAIPVPQMVEQVRGARTSSAGGGHRRASTVLGTPSVLLSPLLTPDVRASSPKHQRLRVIEDEMTRLYSEWLLLTQAA